MTRVVVVTTSYPAQAGDPSGHFVASECRALAHAGARVLVLAPGPRTASGSSATQGDPVQVRRLPGGALFGWPGALPRAREQPARLLHLPPFLFGAALALRTSGCDRVVAHWWVPAGLVALLAAPPRAELEVVAHGSDVRWLSARPVLARLLSAALLARGATLRFVAGGLVDTLAGALPPALAALVRREAKVAPCPVELPAVPSRAEARRALSLPGDEHLEVVLSRLIPEKRIDAALRDARRRGARVQVIGDGPLLGALAAEFPEAEFLGRLPRERALLHLGAADALLTASRHEGAPTVEREAESLGVPVRRVT